MAKGRGNEKPWGRHSPFLKQEDKCHTYRKDRLQGLGGQGQAGDIRASWFRPKQEEMGSGR